MAVHLLSYSQANNREKKGCAGRACHHIYVSMLYLPERNRSNLGSFFSFFILFSPPKSAGLTSFQGGMGSRNSIPVFRLLLSLMNTEPQTLPLGPAPQILQESALLLLAALESQAPGKNPLLQAPLCPQCMAAPVPRDCLPAQPAASRSSQRHWPLHSLPGQR